MTRCDARIRREESRSVGARSHLLRTLSPSLYITWNLQLRVYRLFVRNVQPRQASHRFERSSLVAGRPKPKCHILWHRKSSICKQMQPSFWIYKLPRHLCYDQAKFHEIAYSFLHHHFFSNSHSFTGWWKRISKCGTERDSKCRQWLRGVSYSDVLKFWNPGIVNSSLSLGVLSCVGWGKASKVSLRLQSIFGRGTCGSKVHGPRHWKTRPLIRYSQSWQCLILSNLWLFGGSSLEKIQREYDVSLLGGRNLHGQSTAGG